MTRERSWSRSDDDRRRQLGGDRRLRRVARLNPPACAVLDEGAAIPIHALLETYSVLTGFPRPHRAAPCLVDTWLEDRFRTVLPPPGAEAQRDLIRKLAGEGHHGSAAS